MRFLAVLLLLQVPVSAQVIVKQPPDLVAGDSYRLLFVTSQQRDGTSSDIDDYNQFVQSVADASPEIGPWNLEWKAIASTEEVDARDNTRTHPGVDPSVPVYGVHSAIFASNYEVIWDPGENSDMKFSMNVTELGTAYSNALDPDDDALFAWTGTYINGTARTDNFLGSERPTVGRPAAPAPALFFSDFLQNRRKLPLFAISEVITAVPEPDSRTAFAFLFLVGVMLLRDKDRSTHCMTSI